MYLSDVLCCWETGLRAGSPRLRTPVPGRNEAVQLIFTSDSFHQGLYLGLARPGLVSPGAGSDWRTMSLVKPASVEPSKQARARDWPTGHASQLAI